MAGGCLGLGIVSARTQTEHDPAYALLYEYVEKVCPAVRGCSALKACPDCVLQRLPAQTRQNETELHCACVQLHNLCASRGKPAHSGHCRVSLKAA